MALNQSPKDEFIDIQNSEKSFRSICEAIATLRQKEYIQLKQWLFFQATVEDWQSLMKS